MYEGVAAAQNQCGFQRATKQVQRTRRRRRRNAATEAREEGEPAELAARPDGPVIKRGVRGRIKLAVGSTDEDAEEQYRFEAKRTSAPLLIAHGVITHKTRIAENVT